MNIHLLSAGSAAPMVNASSTAGSSSTNDPQSMFMQLLTAQLENQTPLDPVDPTQFTSQLVQFNMLDQLTQINQTLQNAFSSATSSTTSTAGNPPAQGAH